MPQWRVSKYDPAHRNERGWYLKDEWTSVFDIGKRFEDGVLSQAAFLEVESRYLMFVQRLMNALEVPHMMVRRAGHHRRRSVLDQAFPARLDNKDVVSPSRVLEVVRDSLRETTWCRLIYRRRLWMEVGWDFYLNFACEGLGLEDLKALAGPGMDVQVREWLDPIRD